METARPAMLSRVQSIANGVSGLTLTLAPPPVVEAEQMFCVSAVMKGDTARQMARGLG